MSVKNTNDTHKVWSKFQATQKDGSVIKLRIQDLPWGQYKDNITDFYMKYFIKDEAFHKAAGITNNEEAKTEYSELIFSYYDKQQPHVSICCLDDDSNTYDILGMSVVIELNKSQSKDDKNFKPKTKEVQNLFRIISVIDDIKASKGYETCYEGRGIIVRPDHRGMGIANEFVRLRKQICIDNNIQMSNAWMTSIGTQKAADKNNWKTFMELPVEEFENRTGLPFKADTPKTELQNRCHVEVVLKKTMRVSQLVGVAPVRFISSKIHTFVVISRPWYIYGVILAMTLNCILFYNMITILQNYWDLFWKVGFLDIIICFFNYALTSFFVSFCVGVGMKRMQLFKSIIHRIRKIKADIRALNHEVSKFWQAWFFIIYIPTNFLIVIIFNTWVSPKDTSYDFYAFSVLNNLKMILVLQFIIMAFYINSALEAINYKLRDLMTAMMNDNIVNNCEMSVRVQIPIHSINIAIDTLEMVKQTFSGKKNTNRLKMAHRLRFLCDAFVLTGKVLKEFSTHLNFIFIMYFSFFILNFSQQLYVAMKYWQSNNLKTGQYFDIIGILFRLTFNITESIMFVEPFYRSKVEISRMRLTVCRMMSLVSLGDSMLDELDVFSNQLLLNNFSYNAFCLISLERNLTYKMIGVIATVLSIFQQFMNADDN